MKDSEGLKKGITLKDSPQIYYKLHYEFVFFGFAFTSFRKFWETLTL